MPDNESTTLTTEQNDAQPPAASEGDGETPPFDFTAWLVGQSDEIKAAFEGHVSGLKSALDAERAQRKETEKSDKARKKAAEDAEQERLKAQGEYQKLAEQAQGRAQDLETKLAELEPLPEQLERYKGALEGYVKAAREGVPAHVIPLLERLDPIEQLEYLTAHAEELRKPTGGPLNQPSRGVRHEMPEDERRKQAFRIRSL